MSSERPEPRLKTPFIPPRKRRQLTERLVLATAVAWAIGGRLGSSYGPSLGLENPDILQGTGIVGIVVAGTIAGAAFGVLQMFSLWGYVQPWAWAIATTVGWAISAAIAGIWGTGIPSLQWVEWGTGASLLWPIFWTPAAFVALGIAQTVALRRSATGVWGWLAVPSLGMLAVTVLRLLLFSLGWGTRATGGAIAHFILELASGATFGLVQAIALFPCTRETVAPPASAKTALQIDDPEILAELSAQLQRQLEGAFGEGEGLVYAAIVVRDGQLHSYQPINGAAHDLGESTPLARFGMISLAGEGLEVPHARLQIIVSPSGEVRVRSWTP
ncbi:MAG: hypothetical protein D6680_06340 [Cyanobacteria bacterium J007]|nr:MAG: hypothetical protein D6680_06340 [Cyanobacteria bacterium J007]